MNLMLTLLRYKQRQFPIDILLWGVGLAFLGASSLFITGQFVAFYLAFQHLALPEVAADFILLFVAAWVGAYNINGLPLGAGFAREYEYLATLPIPRGVVMAVELGVWFGKNILLLCYFLLAPLLALALDGALPVPSGVIALLALGLYCGWLVLAGAWLRLHALRGQTWIPTAARVLLPLIFLLAIMLLPIPRLPPPIAAARGVALQVCSWPIWPNVWAVRAAYGQEAFWLPLAGLAALTAWRTLPRLLRFWEERPVGKPRRSRYPFRLLTGSGWAFAKYLAVSLLVDPSIQLVARSLVLIPVLILWLAAAHANAQALWLLALVFISWLLGVPAYTLARQAAEQLQAAGLPLTKGDILRGAGGVLGMIYLPAMGMVVCFIGVAISWTPGLLLAWMGSLAGVACLAWSVWKRVPLLWAFVIPALLGVGLSFLL